VELLGLEDGEEDLVVATWSAVARQLEASFSGVRSSCAMPEEGRHTVSVELPIKFWFSRGGCCGWER
jgi:hypothetical protein